MTASSVRLLPGVRPLFVLRLEAGHIAFIPTPVEGQVPLAGNEGRPIRMGTSFEKAG
jgi:hypothetical protein